MANAVGRTGALILLAGLAASQTTPPQAFMVASVKRTPVERRNTLKFEKCPNGGAFSAEGSPLLWVVEFAYHLDDRDVTGVPAWLESFDDAYDIEGKPEHPVTLDQCRQMVQTLLADRFQLKIHRETRERSVFSLVIAKGGIKFQQATDASNGIRVNRALQQALSEREPPKGWTMSRLASYLTDLESVGRTVVDKTALSGSYTFNLEFARRDDEDRPTIFTALQDQLGLKLEPAKAPFDALIIDRIERPSAN